MDNSQARSYRAVGRRSLLEVSHVCESRLVALREIFKGLPTKIGRTVVA